MECRISRNDYNGGELRINANSVMTLPQAREKFARNLTLTCRPDGARTTSSHEPPQASTITGSPARSAPTVRARPAARSHTSRQASTRPR